MKVTFALLAATLPTAAFANVDADAQLWGTVNATGSLSGPLMFNGEVVARASNDQNRIYEAEVTAQLGYKLSKAVTLWAGYTRVPGYRGALPTTIENRIRQQVSANLGKFGGGALASRTLLEERSRDGSPGTGVRLRAQFKWIRPFHTNGKTALVLWHESFVSLNSTAWGQISGYNRMRNFVGIGTPIVKTVRGEFGYLNQYDFRRGSFDRMAHAAAFTVSYAF
jgi:Protein of unknown function (DUF2490)